MNQKQLNEELLEALAETTGNLAKELLRLHFAAIEYALYMRDITFDELTQISERLLIMTSSVRKCIDQTSEALFPDNEQEKSLSDSSTQAASAEAD